MHSAIIRATWDMHDFHNESAAGRKPAGSNVCSVPRLKPLGTPWTVARQAPLSMRFFVAWVVISSSRGSSRLGDLHDVEIEPLSPALAGRFFTTDPAGQPHVVVTVIINEMRSQCLQVPRWHGR